MSITSQNIKKLEVNTKNNLCSIWYNKAQDGIYFIQYITMRQSIIAQEGKEPLIRSINWPEDHEAMIVNGKIEEVLQALKDLRYMSIEAINSMTSIIQPKKEFISKITHESYNSKSRETCWFFSTAFREKREIDNKKRYYNK